MRADMNEKDIKTATARHSRHCFFAIHPLIALTILFAWTVSVPAADIYVFTSEGGETLYTNIRTKNSIKVRFPPAPGKKKNVGGRRHMDLKNRSFEPAIVQASELFGIDPALVRSVIKVESNYNHLAVSPKGAMGLMQLMPGTARDLGVGDPFDPVANIQGGVMYLRRLLDALEGDIPLSLAAYNAGLERIRAKNRIPEIPETINFVRRVLENYEKSKL